MEFTAMLDAKRYPRTPSRKSKRNGFPRRSLETPVGRIQDLHVPGSRQNLDIRFGKCRYTQKKNNNIF